MRAHVAAAPGQDPFRCSRRAPAAARRPAAGLVGSRYVMRTWTFLMAVAAGLVGFALLVGRMTGVWS